MLPTHISIEPDPAKALSGFLSKSSYTSVCVLVDELTEVHCYPLIEKSLTLHKVIRVKSGEEHKDISTCSLIWRQLTEFSVDRHQKSGMRGTNAVVFFTMAVLGGCAALDARPPEEVLKQRAQNRWDAVVKSDFKAAYEYLSPGSRAVLTSEGYASCGARTFPETGPSRPC